MGATRALTSALLFNGSKDEAIPPKIQVQLAAILEVKHDGAHHAYALVRSLDLEDELEKETTLADLAGACSPSARRSLGVLRFFVASTASLISGMYIVFGILYDSESQRWLGAVR